MVTLNDVISSFTTMDSTGAVTGFNFTEFDALVSALVSQRATLRKENKEVVKAQKEAHKETLNEIGKRYFKSLNIGDEFQYKTADGIVVTGNKIETKSKSSASAAIEVTSGIEFKSDNHKRYPKFYQVIVPADFE